MKENLKFLEYLISLPFFNRTSFSSPISTFPQPKPRTTILLLPNCLYTRTNMSSKTLLDMPDELLLAILNHLKKDSYGTGCWRFKIIDVKTLRASCKRLNRIVSPYLYRTLYLSCHQLDLDVFRLVAKNPLLIGSVRELVIDDTTFPTCINDWNTYKRAVTLWAYTQKDPDFDEDEDDLEEWEIQRRFDVSSSMVVTKSMWEHFNSGIKGHHENRLAHADIAALKEALPKMKSLCSLIVTNCTPFESRRSNSPFARMWRSPPSGGGRRPSWGERPWAPRCDWEPQIGDEPDSEAYSLDWLDDRIFTTVHPGEPDGYDDPYEVSQQP